MPWEVEFYETENGVVCVQEFISRIQDQKLKAKVLRNIELLNNFGTELKKPYADYIRDGIWELRTIQSNNIVRILYFTCMEKKIVLLHGFVKKRQKTPKAEIIKAIKNKDDYMRRCNK